jgi:hypothetical protein
VQEPLGLAVMDSANRNLSLLTKSSNNLTDHLVPAIYLVESTLSCRGGPSESKRRECDALRDTLDTLVANKPLVEWEDMACLDTAFEWMDTLGVSGKELLKLV